MSAECHVPADGFGFSAQDIGDCIARRGLLSMEIELTLACNFRCPYCYAGTNPNQASLTLDEVQDVVRQAKALGAKRIILLGGEPTLYPELHEIINYIVGLGMEIEMFTNGSRITENEAQFLHSRDVAVVLKLNTLNAELQNLLTGCERGHQLIHTALANLRRAGYPTEGKRLAISTIICKDNFDELPELWRWTRSQGMVPYFETITPQGNAKENDHSLNVANEQIGAMFQKLADIDRREFGRSWEPQPPLVGNVCKRHQFSCVVTAIGSVQACVGVTIPLGNIREQPLGTILADSEVLENLRNYHNKIKEPCQSCPKAEGCYGCRGAAYQLTGDYLAADPLCWHADVSGIQSLPVDAGRLIPHGPSMRSIDRLVKVGDREADTDFVVKQDSLLVDEDGRLDETAYVEMIAQSLAAAHGFQLCAGEEQLHKGVLVGIKNLSISGDARVGDHLYIHVRKLAHIGDFGVAEGIIRHADGRLVAQGEIKIWQSGADPAEGTFL